MSLEIDNEEKIEKFNLHKEYVELHNEFIDMLNWFKNRTGDDFSKYKSHNMIVDEFKYRLDFTNLVLYLHLSNIFFLLYPRHNYVVNWIEICKKIDDWIDLLTDIFSMCIEDLRTINSNVKYLINLKHFTTVYEKKNYDLKIELSQKTLYLKL